MTQLMGNCCKIFSTILTRLMPLFSSPDPKVHVSCCYHWASVVVCLSSIVNFSHLIFSETAGPDGTKLGRKHLCKVLYKVCSFRSIRQQTWPPWAILSSDWLNFQKFSPIKPLGQMEANLAESIYGRSYTKFVHFVPIGYQTWLPWAILNSDWLNF